ncbi:hypothetical protein CRENBAI_021876 [Crenichthys baileyi]|uniref:G-protein coupled receptors family 3 profile domain-containing protein n=1 Tax=Crenichthys baileyi TaxID=28760 RepID=A0AAV9R542_9TELE
MSCVDYSALSHHADGLTFPTKSLDSSPTDDKISHSATCECLSSRKNYASFFRTIASDLHQSRALVELVKHFGWTWVGAVNSDSDYGNNGMAIFLSAAQEEGVCVEYTEKFDRAEPEKLLNVIEVIKKSTAQVIVGFLAHVEMNNLLEQLSVHNITGRQFIGVEAWITADSLVTPTSFTVLGGALGFAVEKANISGLEDFLARDFWETEFLCNETNTESSLKTCKENQDLMELGDNEEDVAELRYSTNIYKAIYAVAHSLHSILKCSDGEGCKKTVEVKPWEVVEALKHVNFTIKNGDKVWFDHTGATVARYEVVNWQRGTDGSVQFKPVGYYDASLPSGKSYLFQFAVKAVIQEPIKSFRKENLYAALTVYHVQLGNSATLQPTEWSCMLRHTAFGITFVLCISCILGKTIVVLMAFKATLPDLTRFNCATGFISSTPTDKQRQHSFLACLPNLIPFYASRISLLCLALVGYLTGFCLLDYDLGSADQPSLPNSLFYQPVSDFPCMTSFLYPRQRLKRRPLILLPLFTLTSLTQFLSPDHRNLLTLSSCYPIYTLRYRNSTS